jgi:hypothetical protein
MAIIAVRIHVPICVIFELIYLRYNGIAQISVAINANSLAICGLAGGWISLRIWRISDATGWSSARTSKIFGVTSEIRTWIAADIIIGDSLVFRLE